VYCVNMGELNFIHVNKQNYSEKKEKTILKNALIVFFMKRRASHGGVATRTALK